MCDKSRQNPFGLNDDNTMNLLRSSSKAGRGFSYLAAINYAPKYMFFYDTSSPICDLVNEFNKIFHENLDKEEPPDIFDSTRSDAANIAELNTFIKARWTRKHIGENQ